MGNIGLEPEISREFLDKEYRAACAKIAELTEHIQNSEAEITRMTRLLSEMQEWAHTQDRVLGPPGSDPYEDGVYDCKKTVCHILRSACSILKGPER